MWRFELLWLLKCSLTSLSKFYPKGLSILNIMLKFWNIHNGASRSIFPQKRIISTKYAKHELQVRQSSLKVVIWCKIFFISYLSISRIDPHIFGFNCFLLAPCTIEGINKVLHQRYSTRGSRKLAPTC